jgi:PAS domain S-box-containing protein
MGFRLQLGHSHGPILLALLVPVLLVSYRGGVGPGLLCTGLAAISSAYYLLEPLHSLVIHNPADQVDWTILIVSGFLVSILSESALRARRRAEAGKANLVDRLLMANQTYDGVVIWDWNGPITFWNAAAARIYGFSEKEAVGSISHTLLQTTCADGLPQLLSQLEKEGQWEGELHHMARDGHGLAVKSRMLLIREPSRSYVVEANRDLTESYAAEQEISRIQKQFETAFRLSPLGKLLVRFSDDVVMEANDSYGRILGCDPSEIVGKTLTEQSPLLDPQALQQLRQKLEEGLSITGIDVAFQRKDGSIGSGILYAETLQVKPELHALIVLQDVTTRQRAEDRLKLANYDLQQFAFIAAHDLQEPTRNIATVLGLFNRKFRTTLTAEGIELVEESIEAAKRMNRMIRDMLAFSTAEKVESCGEAKANASDVLSQVLESLKRHISETESEIVASTLPELQIEPTHLLQLFQNLVGNAIKYRSPGVRPHIEIGAQSHGASWTLSVSDNGIGFDPEFASQIFGVFKRLHNSPDYPGNGIGLAICERIVRLYQGRIWAESSPGKGSTFYFSLPAYQAAMQAAV